MDTGATQVWSIEGTAPTTYGSIQIDSSTGVWTYTLDNEDADVKALAEGASVTQSYTARVTDDKGASVDQAITVTIVGTNDGPALTTAAGANLGAVVEAVRGYCGEPIPACVFGGPADAGLREHWQEQGVVVLDKPVRPAKLRAWLRRLKSRA